MRHRGVLAALHAVLLPRPSGFRGDDFVVTFVGSVLGITLLAAAQSKIMLVEMTRGEQAPSAGRQTPDGLLRHPGQPVL